VLDKIIVKGARVHNLKNITVEIPRNKLVVLTGLSGSGKSSLAFDTIYAEGQRRYVESLSAYARQFLGQMDKPDVDSIEGLSPAISINQKTTGHNPRSTVGTVTEIYDYLRLLFARVGRPYCPRCNQPIARQTVEQMVDQLLVLPEDTRLQILAPVVREKKGEQQKVLEEIRRSGFSRVRINKKMYEINEVGKLDKNKRNTVEIVVDRLIIRPGIAQRLADSLETTLKNAAGLALAVLDEKREIFFNENFACSMCGFSLPEISPRLFSFNSPLGACPTCTGLGVIKEVNKTRGRFFYLSPKKDNEERQENRPLVLLCPACQGARLRPEALAIKIGELSIVEVTRFSIGEALNFFQNLTLTPREQLIARQILKEIIARLNFLVDVGLDYLTLDRKAGTLAGGEAQRIRLATQIGSGLTGVLYILDEPSIGLHPRDNQRLLATLSHLRDLGNTVIVVEHDEETMRTADYIVDIGPGAGVNGGEVVAQGTLQDIVRTPASLTGQYLSGKKYIPVPAVRHRQDKNKVLTIKGARVYNLKNIDVSFPLGVFICVTGVSGSGKSTLVNEVLYKSMVSELYNSKEPPSACQEVKGVENVDKVINIDQSPIGRTPRSNPGTYTGVFDDIRELFAQLPEARLRGYKAGRFSFNVKGGRCEACYGDGIIKIEMHFLPAVYVPCEICKGRRYNRETLEVKYKGKNIAEVLDLTVDQALEFFQPIPKIYRCLKTIHDVGLGYIRLGQPAPELSGGEAQRVKLATELARRAGGQTVYILDEPTTGLHAADVNQLLQVLHRLVSSGNTVVVIEHNLDVIKTADYIIDLGPEGGDRGGEIIATGTPEEVIKAPNSYTGQYLSRILNGRLKTVGARM
jgi:excinuclease ABC subunit A